MAAASTPMKTAGTTFAITPSGGQKVTVAKLTSIGEINQSIEEIDVTTLDSTGGYKEFIPGYRDAGEVQLDGFFCPGNASQTAIADLFTSGVVCPCEIKFADQTTVTFNAFVKGLKIGPEEVNSSPRFGATLRLTGEVTITPHAGT